MIPPRGTKIFFRTSLLRAFLRQNLRASLGVFSHTPRFGARFFPRLAYASAKRVELHRSKAVLFPFRMKDALRSFSFAARGFRYVVNGERNFRIELFVAAVVLFGMYAFDLSTSERVVLVLCIVWVLTLELVNTAVERIIDVLKPRIHPYARVIKDVMAAAVLVSSGGALLIGLIIFLPKILDLLFQS